jgi:hypothetical protein
VPRIPHQHLAAVRPLPPERSVLVQMSLQQYGRAIIVAP